ncbi:interleukin-1 receptor type 2-like [Genypterus blacodes]|uniref:interleukin-1 receptor type 2-like n=1 Tax=Genypterus blacodes TaxID=154954 RepID=UPI003F76963C
MIEDGSDGRRGDGRQHVERVSAMHRALLEGLLKVVLVEMEEVTPDQVALFPESVQHLRKKQGAVLEGDEAPTHSLQDSGPGALRQTGLLLIPAVDASHRGLYTCRLTVLIHNQQYKVSRKILLQVQDLDQSDGDLSVTSDPGLISSTVHTPMIQPPVIVSPRNGSVFESPHGSGLELLCKVLTGCQAADATAVEWQVNSQSAEASYLDGWGLLRGRRVTRVQEGCYIELRLVVMALTEVHTRTELKCVAHNEGGRQEAFAQLQLEGKRVCVCVSVSE